MSTGPTCPGLWANQRLMHGWPDTRPFWQKYSSGHASMSAFLLFRRPFPDCLVFSAIFPRSFLGCPALFCPFWPFWRLSVLFGPFWRVSVLLPVLGSLAALSGQFCPCGPVLRQKFVPAKRSLRDSRS